jgi:hypothetical protein
MAGIDEPARAKTVGARFQRFWVLFRCKPRALPFGFGWVAPLALGSSPPTIHQPPCTNHFLQAGVRYAVISIRRYPTPGSVMSNSGLAGSASSFSLK